MCRVIYHPKYGMYNLGAEHPFSPVRAEMVIDLLKEWGVWKKPLEASPISTEELKMIHDEEYIFSVEELSKGREIEGIEKLGLDSADNPIVEGMAEGARYQVGGTVLGAKLLMEGKAKKVLQFGGGFHHAHNRLASGFCIYNDLSMAIKTMVNHGWHVAYLDIDVHHGDGVQEMFYSDEHVMTISIHESGEYLFPGTGWIHELGKSMGRSLKLNVPMEPFSEGDSYFEVLDKVVQPALSWFKPNALVVQAGADAHFSDPLADNLLTTHDYEKIFNEIIALADDNCKGNVMFTFGGGYSPIATPRVWTVLYLILNHLEIPEKLPDVWRKRWQEKIKKPIPEYLHDILPAYEEIPRKEEVRRINKDTIQRLMDAVSGEWW